LRQGDSEDERWQFLYSNALISKLKIFDYHGDELL
jgi:hypothetical protein